MRAQRFGQLHQRSRAVLAAIIALCGLLPLVLMVGTAPQAAAQVTTERVVVTPGEGSSATRFRFVGSGFSPGRMVAVHITSGDGVVRRFTGDDGVEIVWLVSPDGTFALEFVPATRFPGAAAGRWQALFCSLGAPTCQQLDFDVMP